MKKASILLIALMVISIGFLSGCTDQTALQSNKKQFEIDTAAQKDGLIVQVTDVGRQETYITVDDYGEIIEVEALEGWDYVSVYYTIWNDEYNYTHLIYCSYTESGVTWQTVNNTINGSYVNDTEIWQTISVDINGSYYNGSSWMVINDTINGTYTNDTITWSVINNTMNGTYTNTSGGDTNYYVSNSGADSNSGTSTGSPWQNVSKVNAEFSGVINQGDDIYFNRGDNFSYAGELNHALGGTASNPMIIGAYGTGAKPIISNTAVDGLAIDADNMGATGHYIFEYLNISYCDDTAIRIRVDGSHNLTFRYLDLYKVGNYGIHLQYTDTFKIENCNYIDGGRSAFLAHGSATNQVRNGKFWNLTVDGAEYDGIVFHMKDADANYVGSNHWVENCTINNTGEAGIDAAFGSNPSANLYINNTRLSNCTQAGIAAGHLTKNETYENLLISDCNDAFIASYDKHLILRYSTIDNKSDDGIVISQGVEYYNSTNLTFYNNNIVTDGTSDHVKFIEATNGRTRDITFKNNIFYSTANALPNRFINYVSGINLTESISNWTYNMWWRGDGGVGDDEWWYDGNEGYLDFTEWLASPEVDNDLRDDPEFVDAVGGDFTLNASSPCIDTGDWLTQTNGTGTTTTWVTVDNANYFFDGYDIAGLSGDNIFVGTDTDLVIVEMNYANKSFQVDRSISWADNENVSLSTYNNTIVDIGAREFPATGNIPPNKPTITGETNGKKETEYPYDVMSTDPDDDKIKYIVDWGDDTNITTILYNSGETVTVKHTWSEEGAYIIRVKAVDEHDAESDWETLEVSMPVNQQVDIHPLFQRILERFPNAFPILRKLLGLQ